MIKARKSRKLVWSEEHSLKVYCDHTRFSFTFRIGERKSEGERLKRPWETAPLLAFIPRFFCSQEKTRSTTANFLMDCWTPIALKTMRAWTEQEKKNNEKANAKCEPTSLSPLFNNVWYKIVLYSTPTFTPTHCGPFYFSTSRSCYYQWRRAKVFKNCKPFPLHHEWMNEWEQGMRGWESWEINNSKREGTPYKLSAEYIN